MVIMSYTTHLQQIMCKESESDFIQNFAMECNRKKSREESSIFDKDPTLKMAKNQKKTPCLAPSPWIAANGDAFFVNSKFSWRRSGDESFTRGSCTHDASLEGE